jgi:CBS domain-containing protein
MALHFIGGAPPSLLPVGWDHFTVDWERLGEWGDHNFCDARVGCERRGEIAGATCLLCERFEDFRRDDEGRLIVHCRIHDQQPIGTWMKPARQLVTAPPWQRCGDARARLRALGAHELLVLDAGRLVGIVTRSDFSFARASDPIEVCMTRELFVISPRAPLGEAAAAMRVLDLDCLPVVDDGLLLGLISRGDLP